MLDEPDAARQIEGGYIDNWFDLASYHTPGQVDLVLAGCNGQALTRIQNDVMNSHCVKLDVGGPDLFNAGCTAGVTQFETAMRDATQEELQCQRNRAIKIVTQSLGAAMAYCLHSW